MGNILAARVNVDSRGKSVSIELNWISYWEESEGGRREGVTPSSLVENESQLEGCYCSLRYECCILHFRCFLQELDGRNPTRDREPFDITATSDAVKSRHQ